MELDLTDHVLLPRALDDHLAPYPVILKIKHHHRFIGKLHLAWPLPLVFIPVVRSDDPIP